MRNGAGPRAGATPFLRREITFSVIVATRPGRHDHSVTLYVTISPGPGLSGPFSSVRVDTGTDATHRRDAAARRLPKRRGPWAA